jgi:hypothetical protein
MPEDISMCRGGECLRQRECYRCRAVPSQRQSYFVTPPVRADGSCDSFLELQKDDVLTETQQTTGTESD